MTYGWFADVVVAMHVSFIAFVLLGGFAAWRWPRLVWAHLPAVALTGVLFSLGADCPLTDVEKGLRRRAGWPVYREGFVAHYLLPGMSSRARGVVLPIAVVTLTAVAYLGLVVRLVVSRRHAPAHARARRSAPATPPAGPHAEAPPVRSRAE